MFYYTYNLVIRIPRRKYFREDTLARISKALAEAFGTADFKLADMTPKRENIRYGKILLQIPRRTYWDLAEKHTSISLLVEKAVVKALKLPGNKIYVEEYKPKYITRYIKENYRKITLDLKTYLKIEKYSKEENMTKTDFIRHLIEIYEQLRGVK